ncbi:MAG: hypothetical protein IIC13_18990 [SAR324 cluster bacterium]|nr:hypothetical protein [SAR324 cluster bacterium]
MNDREDVDFESASVLVKSSRNNLGCFDDSIRESPVHGDGPVERPSGSQHLHLENIGPSWYKTVNIYSLALNSWKKVEKVLNRFITENRIDEYYESVFAEMVAEGALSFDPVFFDPAHWHEIDTNADLERAERMFADRATHFHPSPALPKKVLSSG